MKHVNGSVGAMVGKVIAEGLNLNLKHSVQAGENMMGNHNLDFQPCAWLDEDAADTKKGSMGP